MENIDSFLEKENSLMDLYDVEKRQSRGYMARALICATMPHSEPQGTEFKRINGNYTLVMVAPKDIGLPYGPAPRLALALIFTEAVKTGNRCVYLGKSFSEFMKKAGYAKSGGIRGTFPNMRNQLRRLFNATVSMHYLSEEKPKVDVGFRITSRAVYFWDNNPLKPETSWDSEITLTEEFFKEIIKHPVPIDLNALQALKNSSLALDIYMWITYRIYALNRPVEISWERLALQFGSQYSRLIDFKRKFIEQLKSVLDIYPVMTSPTKNGLLISPSSTHIPRRL